MHASYGLWAVTCPNSSVHSGAIYIIYCFWTGGCKRWPNLAVVSWCLFCVVIYFVIYARLRLGRLFDRVNLIKPVWNVHPCILFKQDGAGCLTAYVMMVWLIVLDSHPLLTAFQVVLFEHIIMCRLITGNKTAAIQEACSKLSPVFILLYIYIAMAQWL